MDTDTQDQIAPLLAVLQGQYPDFTVRAARFATSGQNNTVLIVNNVVVFRFPRYPAGITTMQREVALLRAIRAYLPLPIPDPIYAGEPHAVVGRAFTGYPLLPGEPLGTRHVCRAPRRGTTRNRGTACGVAARAARSVARCAPAGNAPRRRARPMGGHVCTGAPPAFPLHAPGRPQCRTRPFRVVSRYPGGLHLEARTTAW